MSCTALTSSCNEQGRWCCSLGKNQIIKVTESVDWGNQENKHFKTFSQLVTYDVNKFFPDYDLFLFSTGVSSRKKKNNCSLRIERIVQIKWENYELLSFMILPSIDRDTTTKSNYLNLDQIIININLSTRVFSFTTKIHKFQISD